MGIDTRCTCGADGCPFCSESAAVLLAMSPAERRAWHWRDLAGRAAGGEAGAAVAMRWLKGHNAALHALATKEAEMERATVTGGAVRSYSKALARMRPATVRVEALAVGKRTYAAALARRAQEGGAR